MNGLVLLILREALNVRVRQLPHLRFVVLVAEHFLVVLEHLLGKAFEDPRMLQGFESRHSLYGVPDETLIQKVEEVLVVAPEHVLQLLLVRIPDFPSGIRLQLRNVVAREEDLAARGEAKHCLGRHAVEFHDVGELLHLTFPREQRKASVELGDDGTKAPHIDGCRVRYAENDLWSAVKPRLNVRIDALAHEAAAAVVDHLDARFVLLFEKNILRLHITVDQSVVVVVLQRLQNLDGEPSDQVLRHALEVVVLDELVEIDR